MSYFIQYYDKEIICYFSANIFLTTWIESINLRTFLCHRCIWAHQSLEQGCTTQLSWRAQNFFFACSRVKTYMLTHIKGCFYERNKLNKQYFGLCGQHLARGPYVVHAWFRVSKKNRMSKYIANKIYNFKNIYFPNK